MSPLVRKPVGNNAFSPSIVLRHTVGRRRQIAWRVMTAQRPRREQALVGAAWGVHILTASGAVLAVLALLSVLAGQQKAALGWLVACQLIDGLDGPLARWLNVKERAARIDGVTLDLVVDYLPYVLIPAVYLHLFQLLPSRWSLMGVAAVLFSSLYCFARTDMKATDNAFVGFPALWNAVLFVMIGLGTGPFTNLAMVVVFSLLTFTDVRFAHPVRVRLWRPVTLAAVSALLAAVGVLIVLLPDRPLWLRWVLVVSVAEYLLVSAVLTWRAWRTGPNRLNSP